MSSCRHEFHLERKLLDPEKAVCKNCGAVGLLRTRYTLPFALIAALVIFLGVLLAGSVGSSFLDAVIMVASILIARWLWVLTAHHFWKGRINNDPEKYLVIYRPTAGETEANDDVQ